MVSLDTIKERLFRVCFLPMSQNAAEKSIDGNNDAGTDGDESDIGSFIDSDDGDMAGDEEAYENLRTTVRTIVRSLYPASWGTDKPDHPVSAQPFGTLPWMPA